MRKICSKCKKDLLLTCFHNKTSSKDGKAWYCKQCSNAAAEISKRKDRKANPVKYRSAQLQKKYGISQEEYHALLLSQNGVCAICAQESPLLEVDHDHVTGRIRGLLCRFCNLALGNFKDNVNTIYNALEYLTEN